jgi:alkanesulfonate monooxygenase SsuD/methylene tetrahydromethanopterin reductase-like flavin-dependent oxidoreductase (luciferase family)
MTSIGVIAHLDNPTVADVEALAAAAEDTGADWLGLADAFWWRDVWLLLAAAGRATQRIALGPVVTNPYLRHRFHTFSAIATLQDLIGPRVFLGLGAGGSEVSGAAGVPRADAGPRIEALVHDLRAVTTGAPLDERSGRRLEVPLAPVRVLVAGRGPGVLRAAGRVGDDALLWAIPDSDLERSVGLVRAAGDPRLVWAPLVVRTDAHLARARSVAAYGILNAAPALRARWAIDDATVAAVRAALLAGGAANAAALVPDHVLADVAVLDPDPARLAARAASIGATAWAVPAYAIEEVADQVAMARAATSASTVASDVSSS